MDATSRALLAAQVKAEALFAEVVECGMISAGKYESELTAQIHALAQAHFGLRRHWHRRIARCGPNATLTYYDDPADRRIGEDDIVSLDLGPVFEDWEADFGRSYVLGSDPVKHRLVGDLSRAFRLRIRHGNDILLRASDEHGAPRHWILEIHFIDRAREIGGFYEELLTVDPSG